MGHSKNSRRGSKNKNRDREKRCNLGNKTGNWIKDKSKDNCIKRRHDKADAHIEVGNMQFKQRCIKTGSSET